MNKKEPKYIDIHSHINFSAFDKDRDAVIARALDNGTWIINVGTQIDTSKKAIELAHQYKEGVYAIIGLHPIHTEESFHDEDEIGSAGFKSRAEVFEKDKYRELLRDEKVVAIGECGLDYFHLDEESITKQKEAFIAQIELANEIRKPLMIHVRNNYEDKNRNTYEDVLEILKTHAKVKGVIHFFAGSLEKRKILFAWFFDFFYRSDNLSSSEKWERLRL